MPGLIFGSSAIRTYIPGMISVSSTIRKVPLEMYDKTPRVGLSTRGPCLTLLQRCVS